MRKSKSLATVLLRTSWDLTRLRVRPGTKREARAGERLAAELGSLRGVYTKLGQELARRPDLFSDAFRAPLARLRHAAPPVPFAEIEARLLQALGSPSPFASIERRPLGTASIAQVHRARLRDGRQVAVKVRHAELSAERVAADVAALRRAARRLRPLVRAIDVEGLAEEIAGALETEIDLLREAQVASEIRRNLADDPRVVVPAVHPELTTSEVLTCDYVPGLRLDDPAALRARGVDVEACVAIVVDAYGRQVFESGLFHADPHPGNLYLVDETDPDAPADGSAAAPRILFVDFGLAQRLRPELREELRRGIRALLARDVDALLGGLERIGALAPGREREARSAAERALSAGAADALGAGAATIHGLRDLGKRLVRESRAFRVPRELVLYARTLSYVYDLAEGISPGSDPMPRLLPHLLRFVTRPPAASSASPVDAQASPPVNAEASPPVNAEASPPVNGKGVAASSAAR